ncbi:RNA polymerase subunit sigma-70 [Rhodococcus sp. HNM0569]|uniref:RNA polymerase subunit sigma-70 n=1 Tax=Rhodococcus sp. HNM0569 TaxID=2716340 RepID=UPI001F100719|nr:RNA polymerase subunit sigma-70 [Rhodococcus sp. HNM0569]
MTQGRIPREFGSTEHLASEAIAAYVDGELRMNAYLRAAHHLALCPSCAAEVESQQEARRALRCSGELAMPAALQGLLNQIPSCQPPAARSDAAGSSPSVLGHAGRRWSRRRRRPTDE